ncbi:MAG: ATP-binding cassette domain-containing protein [Paracoccaceae bacterium]|nr:ATP-binding cassette domain-containing protein [Paracoccaceae bacterium]
MVMGAGIVIDALELRRSGRSILGPLSLRLAPVGLTIVMGPNGSGKTSFLRALHGLERINRGAVHWPGDAVTLRARQAFVFQTPILMRRSVADCIAYPLLLDGMARRVARNRAEAMAAEVGLGGVMDRPAGVLSGGERQKMALARALIRGPQVLFLDEPCANLDGRSTREIEAILHRARAGGTRIIMSTHDIGQARRLADDVVFLHDGRLIETAPRGAFFDAPKTSEATAYLNGDLLP